MVSAHARHSIIEFSLGFFVVKSPTICEVVEMIILWPH